jgi:hypothetical protein
MRVGQSRERTKTDRDGRASPKCYLDGSLLFPSLEFATASSVKGCYGPTQLGLHTTYHLQRTTYNVPPTTYHLQRTTYNISPTTYQLQCTAYNVPSTLSQVQCTPLHLPPTNATTLLHCTQYNGSLTLSPTQCTAHIVLSLPFLPFSPQRTPHNVNAQCNYTL